MADQPKSRFELNVELVKAVAWPLLAAIVLASFWSPLHNIADQLPTILGRSDTITFAGLSLRVSPGLRAKAPPDVQKVLPQLSREGLERIIAMSSGGTYWDKGNEADGRSEYGELIKLGLLEETPSDELEKRNAAEKRNYGLAIHMTALGRQTQAFLRSVVAEFVQQVSHPQPETPIQE
jgi:hypothetical protein